MGISGILGALSLLGFLLFLVGIGSVVVAASQGRPVRGGVFLGVAGLAVGLVFSVVSQGILIVQPTEVGVIFNTLSGQLEQPRRAGTSIVIPVIQTYTIYPIEQQEYTMSGISEDAVGGNDSVRARTSDGQEIRIDITVLYGIDPDNVNTVHQRWRDRYESDFVRPTVRGFVREVVSRFRAQDVYGQERGEMEQSIQDLLAARMTEEGLTLTDLLVRDITFSEDFARSIEEAQIAEQQAVRARLRVEQIRQEAEQARAEAEGIRDAAITRAQGDAQAIILRAQADAEALRLVSEQIAANPSLIQYEYIRNLSDNVNLALVPSNSPFLFDFESLAEPMADFSAPEVPDSDAVELPAAVEAQDLPGSPMEIAPTPTPSGE